MNRHDTVRRLYEEEGPGAIGDLVSREFEHAGDGMPLGLGVMRTLFPSLRVSVVELFDAPTDRVVARLSISLDDGGTVRRWNAVTFVTFKDDQVIRTWTLQDPVPLLQALGVVCEDRGLERALDRAAERHRSG